MSLRLLSPKNFRGGSGYGVTVASRLLRLGNPVGSVVPEIRRHQSTLRPFHHAFPVNDLAAARHFYGTVLGCEEGRSTDRWIDFNLFGHQIVAHHSKTHPYVDHFNPVDGDEVPVPHFGAVLGWQEFETFAERLKGHGVQFMIKPHVRFPGQTGEQCTMFFKDPAGNNLEFKALKNPEQLFSKFTAQEQQSSKE